MPPNDSAIEQREAAVTNPDWEDVQACLHGDANAYGRLMKRHESQIISQIWRLCRDRATCEELVQDVFVEGYFHLSGYRGEAPFIRWLRRIATRVGYRYCKRTAGRPPHFPIENHDLAAERSDSPDPARAAALVHALLARLPPKDRLVLTMFYLEGCGTGEIADRTGWNPGAVKMRASRARAKLRKIVEREGILEDHTWNL
ncbi:MAG: RNA polymerase sigma factor [Planctomycetota bacterium]